MGIIDLLDDKLKYDITEYCKLNNISDIDLFINKIIRQGYTIEKYGNLPFTTIKKDEPEKIAEIIPKEEEKLIKQEEKNNYIINIDLKDKKEKIEDTQEDDIYGEKKSGVWGSNLLNFGRKK